MSKVVNEGWVELVFGPMFAGKTEYIIHRINRLIYAKEPFLIIKHQLDDRKFAADLQTDKEIMSRNGTIIRRSVHQVANGLALKELVQAYPDTRVVIIDEIQFFDEATVDVVNELAMAGKQIIMAGLDKNYHGDPFPIVAKLACLSDEVHKLSAICTECQEPGTFTQLVAGPENRNPLEPLVGNYEFTVRCRKHFVPKGIDPSSTTKKKT